MTRWPWPGVSSKRAPTSSRSMRLALGARRRRSDRRGLAVRRARARRRHRGRASLPARRVDCRPSRTACRAPPLSRRGAFARRHAIAQRAGRARRHRFPRADASRPCSHHSRAPAGRGGAVVVDTPAARHRARRMIMKVGRFIAGATLAAVVGAAPAHWRRVTWTRRSSRWTTRPTRPTSTRSCPQRGEREVPDHRACRLSVRGARHRPEQVQLRRRRALRDPRRARPRRRRGQGRRSPTSSTSTPRSRNRKTILQSYLGVINDVDDASQNLRADLQRDAQSTAAPAARPILGSGVVPPNNQGNATPLYNQNDNGENPAKDGVAQRGRSRPLHRADDRGPAPAGTARSPASATTASTPTSRRSSTC